MWGMLGCDLCAAGQFQTAAGQSACDRCPKATFANGTGSALCASCPDGKTTDGTGLTSFTDCVCPQDSYLPKGGRACLECPVGMSCKLGSDMQNLDVPFSTKTGTFPVLSPRCLGAGRVYTATAPAGFRPGPGRGPGVDFYNMWF